MSVGQPLKTTARAAGMPHSEPALRRAQRLTLERVAAPRVMLVVAMLGTARHTAYVRSTHELLSSWLRSATII
jgi:hypothetical protein